MSFIEIPFEVEQNYAGWRLDRYLQQKIPRLSRQRIQRIVKNGVRCETRKLKPSTSITAGLKFVVIKPVKDEVEVETSGPVRVLYDDAHLLVLDKPAGLAVHPSARYSRHTITQWMSDHALGEDGVRPDLGHRLDRETSGVLACGRGIAATRKLKHAFRERRVEKAYMALCEGRIEPDALELDAPMRLTERVKVYMEVHPDGLESHTSVSVLRRGTLADGSWVTLVECRPTTGRQHQIRVHLKHAGHPIIGDKMYGGEIEQFLRFCDGEQTDEDRARLRLPRQALHASRLRFPHPFSGETLVVEAPLAEDIQAFCDEHVTWEEPFNILAPSGASL